MTNPVTNTIHATNLKPGQRIMMRRKDPHYMHGYIEEVWEIISVRDYRRSNGALDVCMSGPEWWQKRQFRQIKPGAQVTLHD